MKWFVIIFFASWNPDGSQDVFVFKEPIYEDHTICIASLYNPAEIEKFIQGLMVHYKGVLPGEIDKVNCIDEKAVGGLFNMKQKQENEMQI